MERAIDRYCELLRQHGLRLIEETDSLKKTFTPEEIQELESFNHASEKTSEGWAFLAVIYAYMTVDIGGIPAGTPRPAYRILTDAYGIDRAFEHLHMIDDCVVTVDSDGSVAEQWDPNADNYTDFYILYIIQTEYMDWIEGRVDEYIDPDEDENNDGEPDDDWENYFDDFRVEFAADDSTLAPDAPPIDADDFHVCMYSIWEKDAFSAQEFKDLQSKIDRLSIDELDRIMQEAHEAYDGKLKTKEGRQWIAAHPILGSAVIDIYIITMRLEFLKRIIYYTTQMRLHAQSSLYIADAELENIRNGAPALSHTLGITDDPFGIPLMAVIDYENYEKFNLNELIRDGLRLIEEPNKPERYEKIPGSAALLHIIGGVLEPTPSQTALILAVISYTLADIDGKGAGTPRTAEELVRAVFPPSIADAYIPDVWALHLYGIISFLPTDNESHDHRFFMTSKFLGFLIKDQRICENIYTFFEVQERIQFHHQVAFDPTTNSYARIRRAEEHFSESEFNDLLQRIEAYDPSQLDYMTFELLDLYDTDQYFSSSYDLFATHPIYSTCIVDATLIPFRAYILFHILTFASNRITYPRSQGWHKDN